MQKDTFRAGSAGPTGSNQTQGAGTIPSKVSVPLPGTIGADSDSADKPYKKIGPACKAPAGFNSGLIPGKI